MEPLGSIVVGAGQAGLSASYHLRRRGVPHVVLDADAAPGGAWQHRAHSLTMADVHGVAQLPDEPLPDVDPAAAARDVVPAYFADYERRHDLPVVRPVAVHAVRPAGEDGDPHGLLVVEAGDRTWTTRTLVNATGTWRHPFVPYVAGVPGFRGRQLHSSRYDGPAAFAGLRVLVVGGGASAVQIIGELAPVADVSWVTRRAPVWRDGEVEEFDGRAAVALVEERVRRGLPPRSVVSVTGLFLRPQEEAARRLGVYDRRRPMPSRFTAGGVVWDRDGAGVRAGDHLAVDVVVWATGFRPVVDHLSPLRLRAPGGGIALDGTTAVADPRVQLVGYGPSASTIGANRAGRAAAVAVRRLLTADAEAQAAAEDAATGSVA
ncbi:NAD(P)-binding domain-containing protein [Nocardioides alkalitolerans]|uniref:NAD(P)-binding domain-containing protein n=1 Tax=Nocardioides alkalitolerans TaxID=281714 RepID=UPI000407523C|nr:NAD(P)-binding domain-containing protein [Nocardioides alkalitolerans]